VLSSKKNALGLTRAKDYGIKTEILRRQKFKKDGVFDEDAYCTALANLITPYKPDLVVMAGFMTRLTAPVLDKFKVINVHPALLPMFGGAGFFGHHVHEAVLKEGVKITGATVHFAQAEYDRGPIVMQKAVEVLDDDTADTLAARVQAAERQIYPKAVAAIARGEVIVEGNRTRMRKGDTHA